MVSDQMLLFGIISIRGVNNMKTRTLVIIIVLSVIFLTGFVTALDPTYCEPGKYPTDFWPDPPGEGYCEVCPADTFQPNWIYAIDGVDGIAQCLPCPGAPEGSIICPTITQAPVCLSIEKSANPNSIVEPEQIILYGYVVCNCGQSTIDTISVSDSNLGSIGGIPDTLTSGQCAADTVPYMVPEIDCPGPIENTAYVSGKAPTGEPISDEATATVNFAAGLCPTPAPEFPTLILPATMIFGFLGAVLFIHRIREQ
jgi:hypothetical protein